MANSGFAKIFEMNESKQILDATPLERDAKARQF
jgi:hypothetical protein